MSLENRDQCPSRRITDRKYIVVEFEIASLPMIDGSSMNESSGQKEQTIEINFVELINAAWRDVR